jgi:hypothetical protein
MNNSHIPVTKATVRIKTDDIVIKEDYLLYDTYQMRYDDTMLNEIIGSTRAKCTTDLADADTTLTLKIVWMKDAPRNEKA